MWVHLAVTGKFYKAIVPPLIIVMAAAGNQCANTAPTAWHPAQSECQGLSCQNGLCKERLFKLVAHAGATRVKADRSPPFCSPVTESVHQPFTVIRRVSTSRGQFQHVSTDPSGFNDRPSKHHISVRVIEALIARESLWDRLEGRAMAENGCIAT